MISAAPTSFCCVVRVSALCGDWGKEEGKKWKGTTSAPKKTRRDVETKHNICIVDAGKESMWDVFRNMTREVALLQEFRTEFLEGGDEKKNKGLKAVTAAVWEHGVEREEKAKGGGCPRQNDRLCRCGSERSRLCCTTEHVGRKEL